MTQRLTRVTIVGGGTSGWLTAMILNTFLNTFRENNRIHITLIESPNIPTVGVGEATVTAIPKLMKQLAIDEAELFRRSNTSFKMSVRFSDWALDRHKNPVSFYHPFNSATSVGGYNPAYHFLRFGGRPPGSSIVDNMIVNTALIHASRGPRSLEGGNYDKEIGYAYHLDAGLFSAYLREIAVERGIEHIRDDVVHVETDERGFISALQLKKLGRHPVEFVIDCTGFRGLIINEVLKEPFISFNEFLLNDRAIPVQLPHRDPNRIEACTGSTALSAGWVWRVPLFNRLGTGYVYSSAFRSDDEARTEFFNHLRAIGDLPADAPDPETPVIKIRVGRSRRFWVKNCLAIGLASGFVEPLEATGLFLIDVGARWFVGHFPDKDCSEVLSNRYNEVMIKLYDEIRDFIQVHYYTSNRPEPYWKAASDGALLSDRLRGWLDLWRHRLPEDIDTRGSVLFSSWNYIYVLHPKGFFRDIKFPLQDSVSRAQWDAFAKQLEAEKAMLLSTLPDHVELLKHIRKEPGFEAIPRKPTLPLYPLSAPGMPQGRPRLPGLPQSN